MRLGMHMIMYQDGHQEVVSLMQRISSIVQILDRIIFSLETRGFKKRLRKALPITMVEIRIIVRRIRTFGRIGKVDEKRRV